MEMEPGFYPKLTNDEYHSSDGYSSSQLKKFLQQTPASILYNKINGEQKSNAEYDLGSAVHCLVLEPDNFDRDFAVSDVWNLRTKDGRAKRDQFTEDNAGKTVITMEQYALARQMSVNVLDDMFAGEKLKDTLNEGSFYWTESIVDSNDDEQQSFLLKVRPDALSLNEPIIWDVKTCKSAAFTDFQRDILKYKYHLSAAMYLHGVNATRDFQEHMVYNRFGFICVEKEPPYQVACYELSDAFLMIGRQLFLMGLSQLQRSIDFNWPSYPIGMRLMEPPIWADRVDIV